MKRWMVIFGLAAFVSAMVAANGSQDKGSAVARKGSSAEYAIILKTQATDFWVKMWKGIEKESEATGVKVDLYSAQSEEDLEGQLSILEYCISKGYKGIGVAPLSGVNVLSGIGKATQAGITIVDVDEKFDEKELANNKGACVAYVATDNVAVGKMGAMYIVDNVPAGSKVLIIEGKSGNQSSEDRKNGARAAFEASGLNIVGSQAADWDRQTALDIANTFIQQHPDLKGIYACNDGMALGVEQAVINAKKVGKILVVGTDGDKEAVTSVANGQLSATVAQDSAKIGAMSFDLLVEAVKKGTKGVIGKMPEKTPVASVLITKDNASIFLKK